MINALNLKAFFSSTLFILITVLSVKAQKNEVLSIRKALIDKNLNAFFKGKNVESYPKVVLFNNEYYMLSDSLSPLVKTSQTNIGNLKPFKIRSSKYKKGEFFKIKVEYEKLILTSKVEWTENDCKCENLKRAYFFKARKKNKFFPEYFVYDKQ